MKALWMGVYALIISMAVTTAHAAEVPVEPQSPRSQSGAAPLEGRTPPGDGRLPESSIGNADGGQGVGGAPGATGGLTSAGFLVKSSLAQRVRSFLGLWIMVAIAWLLSVERWRVRWSLVFMGIGLQIGLGLLTRTQVGAQVFSGFNRLVQAVLAYTSDGATLLFGDLARPGHSAYLAFGVLPSIILFSSLMAILYHLGVMARVVTGLAWLVQRALGTSGAETLSAVGNIFVGQSEAPLLIRPYLRKMTRSELMAVMTGGFATVAGGVMIAYIGMLRDVFPDVAGHLLSASIMSAPASLVVAKIMVPETERPETHGEVRLRRDGAVDASAFRDTNVLDAATRGVSEGLTLTLNVVAMLLAFTALVAMLNGVLGWFVGWFAPGFELTFQRLLGWFCAPLAWLMGIDWQDAVLVGGLLGIKTVLNEFLAYLELSTLTGQLTPRSVVIASYALCGFANFGSVGIQLGGISPLAPERRSDLASLVMRALIGGSLAGFMTACVIGFLI